MDEQNSINDLRDQLFLRIGRNLVNYQSLERLLKAMIAFSKYEGDIRDPHTAIKKQEARVRNMTLGQLAVAFSEDVLCSEIQQDYAESGASAQPYQFKFSHGICMPDDAADLLRSALAKTVEERNQLAHHIFDRWDSKSPASTLIVIDELEEKNIELKSVYGQFRQLHEGFVEASKHFAAIFSSDEFRNEFEHQWLCQSDLVRQFESHARSSSRSDGWCNYSVAVKILRKQCPDAFENLQARYGASQVKKLLLKSERFAFQMESNGKAMYLLYRLVEGAELNASSDAKTPKDHAPEQC